MKNFDSDLESTAVARLEIASVYAETLQFEQAARHVRAAAEIYREIGQLERATDLSQRASFLAMGVPDAEIGHPEARRFFAQNTRREGGGNGDNEDDGQGGMGRTSPRNPLPPQPSLGAAQDLDEGLSGEKGSEGCGC